MTHVSGNPTWQDFALGDTPITAQALEAIEAILDGGVGGSVGWWTGFPIPPVNVDMLQTSPFLTSNDIKTFINITGAMWLPGPQTVDTVVTRTGTAGAAGSVGNVYYLANTAGMVPGNAARASATLLTAVALDGTPGRVTTTLGTPLVIPAEGTWFWFESTDTTVTVRAGKPVGPGANWTAAGSLDAGAFPVAGDENSNTDLGHQYAPALFFHRSA